MKLRINITVGIITRNRPEYLRKCLTSLEKQTVMPNEVLIIDNASKDNIKKIISDFRTNLPVRYIRESKIGIPYARNRALKETRGKILAFIDDDCEAYPNWVEEIIKAHKKYPTAAAIQGQSMALEGSIFAKLYYLGYNSWINTNLSSNNKLRVIDTNNVVLNKAILKKHRISFDPIFKRGSDLDLAKQIISKSQKIFYYPKLKIKNLIRNNLNDFLKQRFQLGMTEAFIDYKWPASLERIIKKDINFVKNLEEIIRSTPLLKRHDIKALVKQYIDEYDKGREFARNLKILKNVKPKNSKNTNVSVAIITWNRSQLLEKCLFFISKQTMIPLEVLIIDNGSFDDTKKIAQSFKNTLPIKYLSETQLGTTFARNKALKSAKGKILAFIDDDCEASSFWIEEIIKSHKQNPSVAAIQGECLILPRTGVLSYTAQYEQNRWVEESRLNGSYIQVINTANVSFKTLLIRKHKIRFDTNFKKYCDDTDFCYQLIACKQKVLYNSRITVSSRRKNGLLKTIQARFEKGVAKALFLSKWINRGISKELIMKNTTRVTNTTILPELKSKFKPLPVTNQMVILIRPLLLYFYMLPFELGLEYGLLLQSHFNKYTGVIFQNKVSRIFFLAFLFFKQNISYILVKLQIYELKSLHRYFLMSELMKQIFSSYDLKVSTDPKPPAGRFPSLSVAVVTGSNNQRLKELLSSLQNQVLLPSEVFILKPDKSKNEYSDLNIKTSFRYKMLELSKDEDTNVKNLLIKTKSNLVAVIDEFAIIDSSWSLSIVNSYHQFPNVALVKGLVRNRQLSSLVPIIHQILKDIFLEEKFESKEANKTLFDGNYFINTKVFKKVLGNLRDKKELKSNSGRGTLFKQILSQKNTIKFDPRIRISTKLKVRLWDVFRIQAQRGADEANRQLSYKVYRFDTFLKQMIYHLRFMVMFLKHPLLKRYSFILPAMVIAFSIFYFYKGQSQRLSQYLLEHFDFRSLGKGAKGIRSDFLDVVIFARGTNSLERLLRSMTHLIVCPKSIFVVNLTEKNIGDTMESYQPSLPVKLLDTKSLTYQEIYDNVLGVSKAKILAFLDGSCTLSHNWSIEVVRAHARYKGAAAIRGHTMSVPITNEFSIVSEFDRYTKISAGSELNLVKYSRLIRKFPSRGYEINSVDLRNTSFKIDKIKYLLYKKIKHNNQNFFRENRIQICRDNILFYPNILSYYWEPNNLYSFWKKHFLDSFKFFAFNQVVSKKSIPLNFLQSMFYFCNFVKKNNAIYIYPNIIFLYAAFLISTELGKIYYRLFINKETKEVKNQLRKLHQPLYNSAG